MKWRTRVLLKIGSLWIGITALVAVILALLVAYSGIFNLAASKGHPAWVNWFLELGMRQSVAFNSRQVQLPENLHLEEHLSLGAVHFKNGCALCHGAPGQSVNPIFENMLPQPPKLEQKAENWQPEQMQWIVYHGLKYAGMPGWSGEGRGDETWSLALFLEKLPEMSEHEYQHLAAGNKESLPEGVEQLVQQGLPKQSLTACQGCHSNESSPPVSLYVPRLTGQSAEYLERALLEYKNDRRQSGFMEPVSNELSDENIKALASYYSKKTVRYHEQEIDKTLIDTGRKIALEGVKQHRLPACLSCHGADRDAEFPNLNGQSALYLTQQLQLWQEGGRRSTEHGKLMGTISQRLKPEQIEAVSAYFASRPIDQHEEPYLHSASVLLLIAPELRGAP